MKCYSLYRILEADWIITEEMIAALSCFVHGAALDKYLDLGSISLRLCPQV